MTINGSVVKRRVTSCYENSPSRLFPGPTVGCMVKDWVTSLDEQYPVRLFLHPFTVDVVKRSVTSMLMTRCGFESHTAERRLAQW